MSSPKIKPEDKLLKEIRTWLANYEETTGQTYGDDESLDGQAYILLSKICNFLQNEKPL